MSPQLNFKYSKRDTKIFLFYDITYFVESDYKWKMGRRFVAFSEYLKFTVCQFRFEAKSAPSNDLLSITARHPRFSNLPPVSVAFHSERPKEAGIDDFWESFLSKSFERSFSSLNFVRDYGFDHLINAFQKEFLHTFFVHVRVCKTPSWSISHNLEHEFFCLGRLGSSGQ